MSTRRLSLLLQLVHCATCDAGMTHTWSRKNQTVYRYYTCIHSIHHGAAVCLSRSVSAPALEQAVVQQLQRLAATSGSPLQLYLTWEHLSANQREKAIAQFVKRVSFDGRSQTVSLALHTATKVNQHAE